jgi:hypothetical protein
MKGFLLISRATGFGKQGILNSELARKWEMCRDILNIHSFNVVEFSKIKRTLPI